MNAPGALHEAGAAAWPEDAVEVGRVLDAWGIKGWIKVQPFASDPQALTASNRWFLKPPEPGVLKRPLVAGGTTPSFLDIETSRRQGDWVVAQAAGVADRSAAEALRGARVFIPRASFPAPSSDEFYWIDLIGLNVVNLQGEALGAVVGLLDTGPHSVLRVAAAGHEDAADDERLIPFVDAYVDKVDLEARRITVDWGLDY